MDIVALIPSRGGSKRLPGKNLKYLGGKPLIAWTIEAAIESGIFRDVYVCSDVAAQAEVAEQYGAKFIHRPYSADDEPDIRWVRPALLMRPPAEAFAILRITAPFRSAATIRDAWAYFQNHQPADSLRAVRFVTEPPQKMWVLTLGGRMVPLLPFHHQRVDGAHPAVPWHSSPTQTLPSFVLQTASMEIAWTTTVTEQHSISGTSVLSYFAPQSENLDINTAEDFARAEAHVAQIA